MDICAKYIKTHPLQSGLSLNGPWSKQEFIVETTDVYPKKVCISIWNGRVDVSRLEVGKEYIFRCNIESKEYKGKWYTEVTLWKINEADLFEDKDAFFQIPDKAEDLEKALNEHKIREYQEIPKKLFREQLEEFEANEKNRPANKTGIETKGPSDQKIEIAGEAEVDPNSPPELLKALFSKYIDEAEAFSEGRTIAEPDIDNAIMRGGSGKPNQMRNKDTGEFEDMSEDVIKDFLSSKLSQKKELADNPVSKRSLDKESDMETPIKVVRSAASLFGGKLVIDPEKLKGVKITRKIDFNKNEAIIHSSGANVDENFKNSEIEIPESVNTLVAPRAGGFKGIISQEDLDGMMEAIEEESIDHPSDANADVGFKGKLKLNPEKIEIKKLSRKITNFKKAEDDFNDPDLSL